MMDQACVQAVEASIYAAGSRTDAAAVLLVELDGPPKRSPPTAPRSSALLRQHGRATSAAPTPPAERARLWQGRKKAFGAMGRIAPDLVVQDAVVPRSALPEILDRIARDPRPRPASPSAMCSTRATATCIPTSASTGASRR